MEDVTKEHDFFLKISAPNPVRIELLANKYPKVINMFFMFCFNHTISNCATNIANQELAQIGSF